MAGPESGIANLAPDVVLQSKARDIALAQPARYTPDLATISGLDAQKKNTSSKE
jgi:hypothetical protein